MPASVLPASRHAGINPTAIANLFHQLMTDVLGYARYGAQGGDFGAQVTTASAATTATPWPAST